MDALAGGPHSRNDPALLEYAAEISPTTSLLDRPPRVGGAISLEGKAQLTSVTLNHFLPGYMVVSVPAALNQVAACLDEVARARRSALSQRSTSGRGQPRAGGFASYSPMRC